MACEDRTFDNILAEMLAMAPDGIDTRQRSIYYDAVAACALKMANFYIDAGCVLDLVFISTTSGEYLDRKGEGIRLVPPVGHAGPVSVCVRGYPAPYWLPVLHKWTVFRFGSG